MGFGGGNSAQHAAQRAEESRRLAIADTTQQVNQIYDAPQRQGQYNDYASAVRKRYTDDANRQKGVADRNLKFSLARGGLAGGSADVDARRTLGEEYSRGILTAEDKAQQAVQGLRSQDEQSRMNLIQLVQSGLDATTAAQRANAGVAQTAQQAQAGAVTGGLGDIFGQTASTYKTQQDAAARRAGILAPVGGSLYGNPYRP
jgi:hypothetical protein